MKISKDSEQVGSHSSKEETDGTSLDLGASTFVSCRITSVAPKVQFFDDKRCFGRLRAGRFRMDRTRMHNSTILQCHNMHTRGELESQPYAVMPSLGLTCDA